MLPATAKTTNQSKHKIASNTQKNKRPLASSINYTWYEVFYIPNPRGGEGGGGSKRELTIHSSRSSRNTLVYIDNQHARRAAKRAGEQQSYPTCYLSLEVDVISVRYSVTYTRHSFELPLGQQKQHHAASSSSRQKKRSLQPSSTKRQNERYPRAAAPALSYNCHVGSALLPPHQFS